MHLWHLFQGTDFKQKEYLRKVFALIREIKFKTICISLTLHFTSGTQHQLGDNLLHLV